MAEAQAALGLDLTMEEAADDEPMSEQQVPVCCLGGCLLSRDLGTFGA
jgi:hypothetical protein